jgi:Uma2 family endonuclease
VEATGCRQRIALGCRKVGPHLRSAVIVVIAVDPMHCNPAIEQWCGKFVQRPVALNVAQKHRGARRRVLRGKACVDIMPVLVNVADENDRHAVPVRAAKRYHGGMVTVRKPPLVRMTLSEFLQWEPGDPTVRSWQLIDGEAVAMAPGNRVHGAIQAELAALLRNHLLERGSPCQVATEPGIVPKLRANRNYRIPDIGVTCAPPSADLMLPEPVLLIEILSPSNEVGTWANVWTYASIPSVTEILVVHTTRVAAELLRREPNGQWPDEPTVLGPDDLLTLNSVAFTVPLRAIYRTTVLAMP